LASSLLEEKAKLAEKSCLQSEWLSVLDVNQRTLHIEKLHNTLNINFH